MANTPEERRRKNAEGPMPEDTGERHMGQQKSGSSGRDPGRDEKPDMPPDPGGRVSGNPSSGHRGALRPEDVVPPDRGRRR